MKGRKSLKLSFVMNSILTCSKYLFPLITFPYISRVLHAEGIGRINFANSVVNYFVMFAMLGIPYYGVQACSKVRDDKGKLSKVVQELLSINVVIALCIYIILFLVVEFVPELSVYKELILIYSLLILCNVLSVEWLYTALEEYSYITIRTLIFKVLSLFLMFLLVKTSQDCNIYAVIMVFGMGASFVFNLLKLPKYIQFVPNKRLELRCHLKPIFSFFLLSVSWTIYSNLDVVMLGILSGNVEVGYYSVGIKIKSILLSAVSALGVVMLPRLTKCVADKKMDEFYGLLKKDCSFIQIVAFSLIGYVVINATSIVEFLAGDGYSAAVPVTQIVIFSVLFMGFSTMTGTNMLVPMGRENITMIATVVGIVVDVVLNMIFIPIGGAAGAALATVIGEISILVCECICLKDNIGKIFDLRCTLKVVASSVIAIFITCLIKTQFSELNVFLYLAIVFVIYFLIYIIALIMFKEEFVVEQIKSLCGKFRRQS